MFDPPSAHALPVSDPTHPPTSSAWPAELLASDEHLRGRTVVKQAKCWSNAGPRGQKDHAAGQTVAAAWPKSGSGPLPLWATLGPLCTPVDHFGATLDNFGATLHPF